MTISDPRRAIEAVWRIESARIIAGLARMVHDVGLAEELAQDALVIALEQWPTSGVPDNPGAWLMLTAKHRAIDLLRRRTRYEQKLEVVGRDMEIRQESAEAELDDALDDHIGDDVLRLLFTACHPALSTEGRLALTLRLLGGLTTGEIARAFLVPEPTVGQRIHRAKRTLADKRVRIEMPAPAELADRLSSVLEVVYLIFNEGYSATAGDDWMRPSLCEEALRLGRVLAALMPEEAEVHGLVALMEIQASRIRTRTGPGGEPVLLLDQDRRLWDRLLIRRGLDALERVEALGTFGPYGLQAAIAACHARALSAEDTDWERMAALYRVLAHVAPSPVVELNRAVAVGMAYGPARGLEIVDGLVEERALRDYPQLPAVRGDLLEKLGRLDEAREDFERAAALTRNERERTLFLARATGTPHQR
ncbi:RNA polymerase, sigma subunit, ECF family [Streptosporangium subroseum]|uniref:RNA polymerase, sigma subunit, ECF family n=1 Tax=Streptosporangium subroseum TaxID=106412 RepID=A0A239NVB7_9ACTN|nr:RNA polymerase sigma factor [Streptosporangium subroseum]SNT58049.1 RNA polymerase, sigma subunit, ECF family [Streptosporangium subroseum]